jgi:predicted  nucleic acid-binding Zn-ribbon protein
MSKILKALEDSIENQQKKLEQMKARKQQIEARLKSAEKKRERRGGRGSDFNDGNQR